MTAKAMQRLSTAAQKQKAGTDEAYRKMMAEKAALRKTKGNFTNHPKKNSKQVTPCRLERLQITPYLLGQLSEENRRETIRLGCTCLNPSSHL